MGECEMDLEAEMEGPMNAAHSHVDIGEIERPATTQGTVQVDTNTSVENTSVWKIPLKNKYTILYYYTMLLPIINGKVLNRHALSVAYVLEWHSSYSLNVNYRCLSIAQCKDVASFGGADHRRMAKLTYLQCKLNIDSLAISWMFPRRCCCIVFYHCAMFMTEQPGDTGSTRTQAPTMAEVY